MTFAADATGGRPLNATHFDGAAPVGALFANSDAEGNHSCTGTVVASTTRNLVLTAAHCVRGQGSGYSFVPQYHEGHAPYGVWRVTKVYADPRWNADHDPRFDYALVQVAPRTANGQRQEIQDLTGAPSLATQPRIGSRIRAVAYNSGAGDKPLICAPRVTRNEGFPAFNCGNYQSGSSGSPWIQGAVAGNLSHGRVTGVIGGWMQGGCTDRASYSAPFTADALALLRRAESGGPGDDLAAPHLTAVEFRRWVSWARLGQWELTQGHPT